MQDAKTDSERNISVDPSGDTPLLDTKAAIEAQIEALKAKAEEIDARLQDKEPAVEEQAKAKVIDLETARTVIPARPGKQTPAKRPPRPSASPAPPTSPAAPPTSEAPEALAVTAAAPPLPARQQAEPAAEQEDYEEVPDRAGFAVWSYLKHDAPSWLISTLVHAITLMVLALVTLTLPEKPAPSTVVAALTEPTEQLEVLEEPEIQLEQIDTNIDEAPPEVVPEPVDPGSVALGEVDEATNVSELQLEIGELSGLDFSDLGKDLGDLDGAALGDGMAMTSFFGVKTRGRRFMFVVDNSNSMSKGKFETSCVELMRAIARLSERQQFYIIFYSDTEYPLFYPKSARSWVPARQENKEKLRYWLDTIQRCLRTKGAAAMDRAFAMHPDVIYLLGDGAFTDNTLQLNLAREGEFKAVMHTMGFNMKVKDRKGFEQLANKYKGKFHEVAVTREMVELSKQKNRPRNREKNGIWGIELPDQAKKKK